jgi:Ca2+-binding RTX toxin-like protein
MMATRFSRITLVVMGLVILGILNAFAATNTLPSKRLAGNSFSISANNLKPPGCSSLNLTNIVIGGNGTTGNDLILGTAGDDSLDGDDGDDCIVGGGGNDTLQGQKGNDIVLGQDEGDSLRGNQDTDICHGGPGTDSGHPSCETKINIL